MQVLSIGKSSGEVIQKLAVDQIVITNTLYSSTINNPDWHAHENMHFCMIFQEGKAETKSATKYSQKGGSIFFYHSNEAHRWSTSELISKGINIEIGTDFLHKYDFTETAIKQAIESRINAKSLMLRIRQEMLLNGSESHLSIESLLLELVSPQENDHIRKLPHWVIALEQLLAENWDSKMTLSEIAQILQIHPITISKNFKKYFGSTLGEYIRKLRIENSIKLIKSSNLSLSQIAFECGFADQSHFIRLFKSHTGFLPKDFRKY